VFPSDLRQAHDRFPNAEITAVYGSTETEPMAEATLSQITDEDFLATEQGFGLLAGYPFPCVRLRVIRDQWGTPMTTMTKPQFDAIALAQDQIGEIVVAGSHVLSGYLMGVGDSETKFDVEGATWHRTGDLGRIDSRGRLWLVGRASAAIRDQHGVLYPFAAECAVMQVHGVRRAAILRSRENECWQLRQITLGCLKHWHLRWLGHTSTSFVYWLPSRWTSVTTPRLTTDPWLQCYRDRDGGASPEPETALQRDAKGASTQDKTEF
jgi:acyl-CoA synthetase (AMP-forming)/AMP-acid ligase II